MNVRPVEDDDIDDILKMDWEYHTKPGIDPDFEVPGVLDEHAITRNALIGLIAQSDRPQKGVKFTRTWVVEDDTTKHPTASMTVELHKDYFQCVHFVFQKGNREAARTALEYLEKKVDRSRTRSRVDVIIRDGYYELLRPFLNRKEWVVSRKDRYYENGDDAWFATYKFELEEDVAIDGDEVCFT